MVLHNSQKTAKRRRESCLFVLTRVKCSTKIAEQPNRLGEEIWTMVERGVMQDATLSKVYPLVVFESKLALY